MGNSSSYSQRRNEISQKLHDKNLVYIAMNDEIKEALETKDPDTVKKLMSEIAAHMIELQQIKALELSNIERGKSQKILKNFEIALASLKSVLIQEGPAMHQSSSQFYREQSSEIEPDIVSGLIHLNNGESMCRKSPSSINKRSTESWSNSSAASEYVEFEDLSLNQKESHTIESVLQSVVSEFDFLMDKLQRPINDVDEYYQIDKGVSFLQLQLNSIELPDNSPFYVTKFKLLDQLESFRLMLDQKSGELEEQQQLSKEVNTLELKLDSAVTEQELRSLSTRAQLLQETIEKGFWDDHLAEKKVEILRRLSDILVKIAYMRNAIKPVEPSERLYGNLISFQNTNDIKEQDELECIQSIDRVLEEETQKHNPNSDESLYANVVVRCESDVEIKPRVHRTSSNASQRGTVYINADIVRQNSTSQNRKSTPNNVQKYLEPINKRPLPLPRNYEEKVISDLPKQWRRLNKILSSEYIGDAEKSEVAEIRKQAEVAKNLFERKIRNIMEKLQESVEL